MLIGLTKNAESFGMYTGRLAILGVMGGGVSVCKGCEKMII